MNSATRTPIVPSFFPAAPARGCGRCRASRRPSRSCRCRTATRCSERRRPARSRCPASTELVTVTNRDYYFAPRTSTRRLGDGARRRPRSCSNRSDATRRPRLRWPRMYVAARHGGDAVMLVLPADHLIRDQAAFALAVEAVRRRSRAPACSRRSASRPALPETGFGYIECGDRIADAGSLRHFARALRREAPARAGREYLAAGNYVWNSGMFCFTAARDSRRLRAPCAARARRDAAGLVGARRQRPVRDAGDRQRAVRGGARHLARLCRDGEGRRGRRGGDRPRHVRLERRRLVAGGLRSDRARRPRQPRPGRARRDRTFGTYVHSEDRVVATVGVENLVIVDTPDAVLVAHRDHLQRVKEVVGELKARGHESVQAAPDRRAAVGRLHGAAGRARLQDQAHRGQGRRLAVVAAPPPAQRALGGGQRHRAGDARRGRVSRRRQRVDVHPGRDAAPPREPGQRRRW